MLDTSVLGEVYRYWFGDLDVPAEALKEKWQRWFQPTAEIDAEIRDSYGRYLDPARDTTWDVFALTHDEQVGLIVLLDQFPRQIFRDSGQAFAYDAKATEVTTAPEQAFSARRGVCQDFAHVMIACLRGLGLPALYVSGYIRTIPPPGKPRLAGDGLWDHDYALDLMRQNVNMPDEFRQFEVNRYLGWPGQAPSYKVGQRIWESVRDAVREREGDAFSFKEFHKRALDIGGVGLDTLRAVFEV